MKRISLLLIVLGLSFLAQAQRFTSFSMDPSVTLNEMKQFYSSVPKDRQKEASDLLESFETYWTTVADFENQFAFIEEANLLLKRKFRPFPHFESYINAYMAFSKSDFATE